MVNIIVGEVQFETEYTCMMAEHKPESVCAVSTRLFSASCITES